MEQVVKSVSQIKLVLFDPDKLQAEMQTPFSIKLLIPNITSKNEKY